MLLLVAVAAGVVLFGLVVQYNRLVYLRQLVRNAWSDVDVYLRRRADLIPNLTASVKAYAAHENNTFEELAAARARALGLKDAGRRAAEESRIAAGLSRALMVAEAYPELKASRNFLALQQELIETERLIASARQYYNACVRDYNAKIESFPSNLVAPIAGCRHAEFFEADSLEQLAPGVSLDGGPNLQEVPPQKDEQARDLNQRA